MRIRLLRHVRGKARRGAAATSPSGVWSGKHNRPLLSTYKHTNNAAGDCRY